MTESTGDYPHGLNWQTISCHLQTEFDRERSLRHEAEAKIKDFEHLKEQNDRRTAEMLAAKDRQIKDLIDKLNSTWQLVEYYKKFGPVVPPKFKTRVVKRYMTDWVSGPLYPLVVQRKRFGIWWDNRAFRFDLEDMAKEYAERLARGNPDEVVEAFE